MTDSRRIAGFIGPILVAIGSSEVVTFRIWDANTPPLIYVNGLLLFVAGLSILRVHNRWTRNWPVVVTLVGWIGVLGGLFRMFAPHAQKAGENASTTIVTAAIACAIGLFLTFKAHQPPNDLTHERRAQPR